MSERRFPIMSTGSDVAGCPRSIPWAMLTANEAQAQDNHSQSLERLAERGGLDAAEALAILEGRRWRSMDIAEASARLRDLVVDYESSDDVVKAHLAAAKLEGKLELLEEIRLGANERLRGMGLQLSPAEAVASAYQDMAIKYSPTSKEVGGG